MSRAAMIVAATSDNGSPQAVMKTSIVGGRSPTDNRLRQTVTSADSVRSAWARMVHQVPIAATAVISSAAIIAVHSAVLPRCAGSSRKSW